MKMPSFSSEGIFSYIVLAYDEIDILKAKRMPEIARFYGIVVQMFYNDHNPPHFHLEYGEFKAVVDFNKEIVRGHMPKRALKLVFEWMELHQEALMENWQLARDGLPLRKIEPLN